MTETNWGEMSERQLAWAKEELLLSVRRTASYARWLIMRQPFFGKREKPEYVKFRRPAPFAVTTGTDHE